MRWLVALSLVLGGVVLTPNSAAAENCYLDQDNFGRPVLICEDGGAGAPVYPIDSRPNVPPVPQWNVIFGPEGEFCISRTGWVDLTGLTPEQSEAARAAAANTYDAMITLGWLPCPGVEGVPVTPTAWILEYIRAIDLPVPMPEIEPGEMLVGLEAFLETGSLRTQTIDDRSPFGPVQVVLTSEVMVVWGDGTVTDWTTAPDGPYPDGEITHVWTRQGHYDVTVTQRWVASWSVGDESGIVRNGLTSEGTLAGFPVEEVEAVVVE